MTKRKAFDPELHRKYDVAGRWALGLYLRRVGATEIMFSPFGEYGIDVMARLSDGREIYLDAEVRENWKRGKFPFDTVHVPERKGKFAAISGSYFVSIRRDFKKMILVPGELLTEDRLVEQSNKYLTAGERFYAVPIEETKRVSVKSKVNP
jgi:hypothetical protein